MMIQSVWKNLTGLQKDKSQLNTSGLTLNADVAFNSSPNTNDLYIHYMDKTTGTLPICGNKDGNIINVLKFFISTSVATVLKCMKWLYPYVQDRDLKSLEHRVMFPVSTKNISQY